MLIHSRVTSLGREGVPSLGPLGSPGVREPWGPAAWRGKVGRLRWRVLAALRAG